MYYTEQHFFYHIYTLQIKPLSSQDQVHLKYFHIKLSKTERTVTLFDQFLFLHHSKCFQESSNPEKSEMKNISLNMKLPYSIFFDDN